MNEPNLSTQTTAINLAYPEANSYHMWISVGACKVRITPGDGAAWVSGQYTDPSGALPLQISTEGGNLRITQLQNVGNLLNLINKTPTLELALGKGKAYTLTFDTGASENHIDVGGLPLYSLTVKQGASKGEIDFSAPNPVQMSQMTISAGAGSTEAHNLSNANFADLKIDGAAGSYKLGFGGTLRRNGHVRLSVSMSSVNIEVPASLPAVVNTEVVMGSVNAGGAFTKQHNRYLTPPALQQAMPALGIDMGVTMGSVYITTV